MAKIKKIVAAALVAAAVGTASMTAYASDFYEFVLNIDANEDTAYSGPVSKDTRYSVPAHATVLTGGSSSKPVSLCVCNGSEWEYNIMLTDLVKVTGNDYVSMRYSRSGMPSDSDEFYLNGVSDFDTMITGIWAP